MAPLLDQIDAGIASVMADGAYDGAPTYDTVAAHGDDIAVIIPPHVTAVLSDAAAHNPSQRDKHIASIAVHGRLGWQKESGYARRWSRRPWVATRPSSAGVCVRVVCLANARKRPSAWPCSTACCTLDRPTPSAARTELLELAWGRGSFARVDIHATTPC